jgi:hypothetical protein
MFGRPKKLRRQVSITETVTAPIKGWNARDPLASMKPDEAVYLDNWFPTTGSVDLRKGSENFSTGMTGLVESLMSYNSPSVSQLFGAVDEYIYDVSASGAVGAAEVSGLTSAQWQHINFTTAAGSFLYIVNGADTPYLYDGATWTSITGASVPAITGVTTTGLINIWQHKGRIWFVESGTLKAWYLPTASVGGAASSFDLSAMCRRGGYLMAGATWTIDAGDGVDDYQVFATSEGEVLVYRGTDPASIATWAIVGRYELGNPIGRRCFCKFAGDLLYISKDGVYPLSAALQSSRTNPRVALTDRIDGAMSDAARNYGSLFGWQLTLFTAGDMLLLNVPTSTTTAEQYVMNIITGAWCRFTGWEAACFEVHRDELYFGTTDKTVKAWTGLEDLGSVNILAQAKSAFNKFRHPQQKRFTMARPILVCNQPPPIAIGINVDYQDSDPSGTLSASGGTGGIWGTGLWGTMLWGGAGIVIKNWLGLFGVGFTAATRLKYEGKNYSVSWVSTDVVYEPGAVL